MNITYPGVSLKLISLLIPLFLIANSVNAQQSIIDKCAERMGTPKVTSVIQDKENPCQFRCNYVDATPAVVDAPSGFDCSPYSRYIEGIGKRQSHACYYGKCVSLSIGSAMTICNSWQSGSHALEAESVPRPRTTPLDGQCYVHCVSSHSGSNAFLFLNNGVKCLHNNQLGTCQDGECQIGTTQEINQIVFSSIDQSKNEAISHVSDNQNFKFA